MPAALPESVVFLPYQCIGCMHALFEDKHDESHCLALPAGLRSKLHLQAVKVSFSPTMQFTRIRSIC